ncbi:uncharacterized protein LOC123899981 [Trifolium pratense]|uniref:uncharacterized protein LOC123899981 n=1 Tax=Trifolium pratense TaxID=57577 RepID=UPI001E691CFC|nr:uncharacterized protein LOC123899981 [Trifolium pratense]
MEAPPFSNSEEDESLFEYLNSLSPLKTKKRVEATQTLNSLGMDYSLLASPDATIYEESTVLMRNYILNTSEPQVSSEEALTDPAHACHYSLESSSQHTKIELPQAMQYNPCSSEQRPLISTEEAKWALELLGKQVPNGTDVQDDYMEDSVEGGTYIREVGQVEANIEGADCDYNNLISITQFVNLLPQSTTNSNYKMQTVEPVASSSYPSEPIAATDRNQTWNNLANVALRDSNPIARGVDELACIMRPYQSYQPEMSSLQRNNYVYTSKSDEMNAIIKENPLLPRKNTSDLQMCVLPRNDFYLNVHPALNNYKAIENEKMSSRRKPESPSCTSSLHFSASQVHHLSPVPAPTERHLEPSENDDFTKSSVHIPGEDFCRSCNPDLMSRVQFNELMNKLFDQNMKKTSKVKSIDLIGLVSSGSEHEMEGESADTNTNVRLYRKWSDLTGKGRKYRNCRCRKSRCLKDYCECFAFGVSCIGLCQCQDCMNNKSDLTGEEEACKQCRCITSNCLIPNCECFSAGVYCTGHCSCKHCLNNGDNEDTILQARQKNDPKVEDRSSFQKRGCVCNKTSCQMKKCKCFKDGVGCSPICKCQGCKNIHGRRKDSTAETKSELEETEAIQIFWL